MSTTPLDSMTDIPRLRARRGFAMAMTIGAIVVIGLLIAGVFFVSSQQTSSSRNATVQEQAFRVAEAGLAQSVSEWSQSTASDNPDAGDSWAWVPTNPVPLSDAPGVTAPSVRITRLNASLYQVVSEATVGEGANVEATRRVSQLVRLMTPTINILGALTVRGTTRIGGSSLINGNDQSPTGWTCSAAGPAKPGIAIGDESQITLSGCGDYSCVSGSPKVAETPLANDTSSYTTFGDYNWDDLVAMANITVTSNTNPAPAFTNGVCNTIVTSNWGDTRRLLPQGACEPYFPIIYIPGNGKFTGGSGQGILLVEGDLEVQGGFQFFGPVFIRGRLKTAGTGGHFNGAVMAANVDLEENTVLGNAVVNYSSCAVEAAIRGAGRAVPVRQRPWSEMY